MQFTSIALLAVLAPFPAMAFGNLDCITIKICANSGCTPETTPFAVDFDWAANVAIVTVADAAQQIPWVATGESEDGMASVLEYGDMDDTNRLLRIEATGLDITAFYTFKDPSVTTWQATCNVRQAA